MAAVVKCLQALRSNRFIWLVDPSAPDDLHKMLGECSLLLLRSVYANQIIPPMYFQNTSFVRSLLPLSLPIAVLFLCSIVCLCVYTEPVAVPVLEHSRARALPHSSCTRDCFHVLSTNTAFHIPTPVSLHQSWSWWRRHLVNTFGGHLTFSI